MSYTEFPPFPAMGARGPQVCEAVRFYLAIVNELPLEQVGILSEHVHTCKECAAEFRLLQQATYLVATLPWSTPSNRVDEAIRVAIQTRKRSHQAQTASANQQPEPLTLQAYTRPRRRSQRGVRMLALAAALLILIAGGFLLRGLIFPGNNAQAFRLPSDLSWNGYVLHYMQNLTDTDGGKYEVEVYQDLGTNQMHIETSEPGDYDIVVVTDQQTMLGEDMLHHVAQTGDGVADWAIDGSMFDLAHLRQDLANHQMNYIGTETIDKQQVYLVRASNNEVLLLNTKYLPVGVLQHFTTSGTGTSPYKTFDLMQTAEVPDSMWDTQVPSTFHMGQLPAK